MKRLMIVIAMTCLAGIGLVEAQPAIPQEIERAREAVAAAPKSARAHLELGMTIGRVLQANPMEGMRFGHEMLKSLETAVDLDPKMPEAYHWLAGYYLNAPPIAGGSIEKAEQTARKLAELDPEGGEALLAMIAEAKRENHQSD